MQQGLPKLGKNLGDNAVQIPGGNALLHPVIGLEPFVELGDINQDFSASPIVGHPLFGVFSQCETFSEVRSTKVFRSINSMATSSTKEGDIPGGMPPS